MAEGVAVGSRHVTRAKKTKTRSTGLRYLLKVAAGTALPEPQYAERADLELAGLLSATLFPIPSPRPRLLRVPSVYWVAGGSIVAL